MSEKIVTFYQDFHGLDSDRHSFALLSLLVSRLHRRIAKEGRELEKDSSHWDKILRWGIL